MAAKHWSLELRPGLAPGRLIAPLIRGGMFVRYLLLLSVTSLTACSRAEDEHLRQASMRDQTR